MLTLSCLIPNAQHCPPIFLMQILDAWGNYETIDQEMF